MKYLTERLKVPTIWQKIIATLTGIGVIALPESQASIIGIGIVLFVVAPIAIKK